MIWGRNLLFISTINLISSVICLQIFISSEYHNFDSNAYGQSFMTNASDLVYQTLNSSFNAEGTINTIIFLQDASNSTKPIVKDINTNSSSKYLLGGKWRIDVLKDNLTYFKSNFTMIEVDGRSIHFHTIVYKPVSNESVDHDIKDRLGDRKSTRLNSSHSQ